MSKLSTKSDEYCSIWNTCLTMPEWSDAFQIVGVVVGLLVAGFGLYKTWEELKRLRQQREKDQHDLQVAARLKRMEFFLAQHRRLFDDPVLSRVLSMLDADDPRLAHEDMWNANRKFLTFIEEISLLLESKLIDAEVAFYMFGYYAVRARDGKNFNFGINAAEEYWRLFHRFCKGSEKFFEVFRKDQSRLPMFEQNGIGP